MRSCAVGTDFAATCCTEVSGTHAAAGRKANSSAECEAVGAVAQRASKVCDIRPVVWTVFHSAAQTRASSSHCGTPQPASGRGGTRQAWETVLCGGGCVLPDVRSRYSPSRNKTEDWRHVQVGLSGSPFFTLHTRRWFDDLAPDVFGARGARFECANGDHEFQQFA